MSAQIGRLDGVGGGDGAEYLFGLFCSLPHPHPLMLQACNRFTHIFLLHVLQNRDAVNSPIHMFQLSRTKKQNKVKLRYNI